MIVYSKILNSYSNIFLIKYLRNNKWFWNHKFFFDSLSLKQFLILTKSLALRSSKVVFVQFEGLGHHFYYYKPVNLADIVFGFPKGKKNIYWNLFFDEVAKNPTVDLTYRTKSISNLTNKVCFISSNYTKISHVQKKYPNLYKELEIYGEYHKPVDHKLNLVEDRSMNSLFTTSQYSASLNIENNEEEGYVQGAALWSLRAMTPPILKASANIKNFIHNDCYINFDEYTTMTKQQRLVKISQVQERLLSGESYLTNLTKDYIEFFRESFSPNNEPDIKKITLESQAFRAKFVTI